MFNPQFKLQDEGSTTRTPPPSSVSTTLSKPNQPECLQPLRYASFAYPPEQVHPQAVQYQQHHQQQQRQNQDPSFAPKPVTVNEPKAPQVSQHQENVKESSSQHWVTRSTSPQTKQVSKTESDSGRQSTPVEQFAPNLQFRKVWDDHHGSRQRNPSLLCDPLTSAPQQNNTLETSTPPPIGGLASARGISPSSSIGNRLSIQRSISSNTINSRQSVTLPPPSSIHRPSSLLANSSFSSQSTILCSPLQGRQDSSASTITPIIAPIPHRNSVASNGNNHAAGETSLSASVARIGGHHGEETTPHPLSSSAGPPEETSGVEAEAGVAAYSLPLTPIGSARSALEVALHLHSHPQLQARSLPGSASGGSTSARMGPPPLNTKIPSISSSLQDRLRPSVFELHAMNKRDAMSSISGSVGGGGCASGSAAGAGGVGGGTNSAPGSISGNGTSGGGFGSIGSHSTVLIFSNKSSSISSTQSSFSYPFQRTSSFGGSISFGTKSSISIAPHEVVVDDGKVRPVTPQSPGHIDLNNAAATISEEGEATLAPLVSSTRLKHSLLRPTTPVYAHGATAHNPRSSSPLSKSHHHETGGAVTKPQPNKKVSVTSMLDDSSLSNAKTLPKLSLAVVAAHNTLARSRSTSPTTVRTPSSGAAPLLPPPAASGSGGASGTQFESKQPLYMSSLIREEKNSQSSSSSSAGGGEESNGVKKITEV